MPVQLRDRLILEARQLDDGAWRATASVLTVCPRRGPRLVQVAAAIGATIHAAIDAAEHAATLADGVA